MRKTLNLSKTMDELGMAADSEFEMATELEELCDFTEVEIGEFEEVPATDKQKQNAPEKIERSVLLTPGNKVVAIKNVIDRLQNMQSQLNTMEEMVQE